ncbi:MAG: CDP-alcohol phosphatidyltransferase family protein [Acidimicrobiia bacterium]
MSDVRAELPRFGPSALLTPANVVTLARLAFTVPLLTLISSDGATWASFTAWTVMGSTDGLDGWLARRGGTTRSGAFLDPLADKVLAIGGLWALAAQDVFPPVAVAIIAGREVAVSAYRTVAGRRGVSLPARPLGKWKTVLQLVAVGTALCPTTAASSELSLSILWGAVALAVVSGADIVRHGPGLRR